MRYRLQFCIVIVSQVLRLQGNLLDLEIVCQETKLRAHKTVMAANSKFFRVSQCDTVVRLNV